VPINSKEHVMGRNDFGSDMPPGCTLKEIIESAGEDRKDELCEQVISLAAQRYIKPKNKDSK